MSFEHVLAVRSVLSLVSRRAAGLTILALAALISRPAGADPAYIYAIHDPGGESNMSSAKGWIVWTEAIGISGSGGANYSSWSSQGYGVIVRLNNGYGSSGTLPFQSQYGQFAARCANFIQNSSGVDYWIIGNETNLPREWPGNVDGNPATGEPITVARYVDCYNQCWTAIKNAVPSASAKALRPSSARAATAGLLRLASDARHAATAGHRLVRHHFGIALHDEAHRAEDALCLLAVEGAVGGLAGGAPRARDLELHPALGTAKVVDRHRFLLRK